MSFALENQVKELQEMVQIGMRNTTRIMNEYDREILAVETEKAYLRAALEEFTETVDDALLLDDELAQAWEDLYQGVRKAREVLDGIEVENESGAVR